MAEANYRHGKPVMIDYTPSGGNVAAGEVVELKTASGLSTGVAHVPIVNNALGALGGGGGVYEVTNLNNSADYAQVYWDDSANKVTSVSTDNGVFGFIVRDGGGGANSACLALHHPYAVTIPNTT